MVKKFSAILVALCVALTMLATVSFAAEGDFKITYKVDYNESIIHYEITTPARYRQIITVTLEDKNGNIVRAEEVHADNKGYASGALLMTGDDAGKETYTLIASGAGYLEDVSYDSIDVYYETFDNVYEAGGTLARFNAATEGTLGALFEEKKAMFNYDFEAGSDYANNSATVHKMFVAMREVDYNGEFQIFTDVQDSVTAISVIRDITLAASVDATRALCENSAALFGIDVEHEDYKGYETAIYNVLLSLFDEEAPMTIADMKKYIQQSIGIAKLNRVDAEEATEVVRTYGEVIGIDISEYEEYIEEYDEKKFNYAFVGMNFDTATDVLASYEERKLNPPAKTEKPSSGGGSSPGGTKKPVTPYPSISVEDIDDENVKKESLTDVSTDHWAYESIRILSEAGVINGFEDGTFKPEDSVTREQFIKMLVAAFEVKSDNATCNFTDVSKNSWYYDSVAIATSAGITQGFGGTFGVGASITREDATVMIYRMVEAATAEVEAFSDDSAISSYAKDAVYALCNAGIINGMGDGSFAPKANLTRAQAAKIIFTALKYNVAK